MERIQNYINKIRGRTEEEKKRAAILWTISITILIFIIWAVTFSLSISNDRAREERLQAEALVEARARQEASTTQVVPARTDSWSKRVGRFIADGAESVSTGFWVIGSWLHQ